MRTLRLNDALVKEFRPIKSFSETGSKEGQPALITSLDFDASGEFAITASADESMRLYDLKFAASHPILSKKYGCHLARFTNAKKDIVHASTKENHDLRYLSLTGNSYVRYFQGHTAQVCALEMHPIDEIFLSGAANDAVRCWDTRSATAQGCMRVRAGRPMLAWHPNGIVFAVAIDDCIHLYDLRTFDKGRFAWVRLPPLLATPIGGPEQITAVVFSANGSVIIASTTLGRHCVFGLRRAAGDETFPLLFTCGHDNVAIVAQRQPEIGCSAAVTADSKYLFTNEPHSGGIAVWSLRLAARSEEADYAQQSRGGDLVSHFHGKQQVGALALAPQAPMIATYNTSLTFWHPKALLD